MTVTWANGVTCHLHVVCIHTNWREVHLTWESLNFIGSNDSSVNCQLLQFASSPELTVHTSIHSLTWSIASPSRGWCHIRERHWRQNYWRVHHFLLHYQCNGSGVKISGSCLQASVSEPYTYVKYSMCMCCIGLPWDGGCHVQIDLLKDTNCNIIY